MLKTLAAITLAVAISMAAFATPKEKETIQIQVVSIQAKTHGFPPGEVYQYTDVMFTRIGGKNITFECAQHADLCPLMESGKAYTAEHEGAFIYIVMTLADGKSISVKYKQVGTW